MLLANWSFTMTSFVVWISTFVSGSHQNINPCLSKIKKVMGSNSPGISMVDEISMKYQHLLSLN